VIKGKTISIGWLSACGFVAVIVDNKKIIKLYIHNIAHPSW